MLPQENAPMYTGMESCAGADGKLHEISVLDGAGKPLFEVLETVELEEMGGKTKMSLNARVVKVFVPDGQAAPYLGGMDQGFAESMDNLADLLEGKKNRA